MRTVIALTNHGGLVAVGGPRFDYYGGIVGEEEWLLVFYVGYEAIH